MVIGSLTATPCHPVPRHRLYDSIHMFKVKPISSEVVVDLLENPYFHTGPARFEEFLAHYSQRLDALC